MKDHETEAIRWTNYRRISEAKRTLMIVEIGGKFEVHDHTPDGVSPTSVYDTREAAAARVLQLLKTGPVSPQTWPETACIGSVEREGDIV